MRMRRDLRVCHFAILLCALSFLKGSLAEGANTTDFPLEAADYSSVCSEAVDYNFFYDDTMSLADLNQLALEQLDGVPLEFLPHECVVDIKKLLCASVYLKYITPATNTIYSSSYLPFERPCKNLCTAAQVSCKGLYAPNCTDVYKYNNVDFADRYGDSDCNAMSASFEVATNHETYLNADTSTNGFCSGIVKDLYIPSGTSISSDLSPFLPPYVGQQAIEQSLVDLNIPRWVSAQCTYDLRRFFCARAMRDLEYQTYDQIFNNSYPLTSSNAADFNINGISFPVPRDPHQDLCTSYKTSCAGFIVFSNTPAMDINCSSLDSDGTTTYPVSNHTSIIVPYNLTLPSTTIILVDLKVDTAPNVLSDSASLAAYSALYPVDCPPGTLLPPDPSHKDNLYLLPGLSPCVRPCKAVFWDDDMYAESLLMCKILATCGLGLLIIYCTAFWYIQGRKLWKEMEENYLVFIYAFMSSIIAFFELLVFYASSVDDILCVDDAVTQKQNYGISICVIQAAVVLYCTMGLVMLFFFQSMELFLKCVMRSLLDLKLFYLLGVFLIPLAPVVAMIADNQLGYGGTDPLVCLLKSSPQKFDLLYDYFYYPGMGVAGLASILLIILFGKVMYDAFNCTKVADEEIMSSDSDPHISLVTSNYFKRSILFVLMVGIAWDFQGYAWYFGKDVIDTYNDATAKWYTCVFATHTNGDSAATERVCGSRPDLDPSLSGSIITWISVSGHAMISALVLYLTASYSLPTTMSSSVAQDPDGEMELKNIHPSTGLDENYAVGDYDYDDGMY